VSLIKVKSTYPWTEEMLQLQERSHIMTAIRPLVPYMFLLLYPAVVTVQ